MSSKITLVGSFSSFQIFGFSKVCYVPLSTHEKLDYPLWSYEFLISHSFQCECYFSFACPVKKYHKSDFDGHCPYSYFHNRNVHIHIKQAHKLHVLYYSGNIKTVVIILKFQFLHV